MPAVSTIVSESERSRGQTANNMLPHVSGSHDTADSVDNQANLSRNEQPGRPASALALNDSDNAPPDGGYGWVCVLACFLVNFATWGVVAVRLYSNRRGRSSYSNYFEYSLMASIYQNTSTRIGILAHQNWTLRSLAALTLHLR